MLPESRLEQPVEPTDVPANYEEFLTLYYEKVRRQVGGFSGIHYQDIDDLTQDILMQFIAGDYLNIFDKDKQTQAANARYEAALADYQTAAAQGLPMSKPIRYAGKFSSFVFEFVKLRLLGKRDKQIRHDKHEGESIEFFFTSEEGEEESLLHFVGKGDPQFLRLDLQDILKSIYNQLCHYTTPTETRNLPKLFLRIVDEEFTNPKGFDKAAYAQEHGISPSAVQMQISVLRDYCRAFGLINTLQDLNCRREREQL